MSIANNTVLPLPIGVATNALPIGSIINCSTSFTKTIFASDRDEAVRFKQVIESEMQSANVTAAQEEDFPFFLELDEYRDSNGKRAIRKSGLDDISTLATWSIHVLLDRPTNSTFKIFNLDDASANTGLTISNVLEFKLDAKHPPIYVPNFICGTRATGIAKLENTYATNHNKNIHMNPTLRLINSSLLQKVDRSYEFSANPRVLYDGAG